jgi:hypothetical protein
VDPFVGRAAFRLGMLVTAPAVVLLLFLPPGTAEFSITVVTLLIGLTFLGLIALLVRRAQR